MVVLRADPWMPDYGMGFEIATEESAGPVDPFVESEDWSGGRAGSAPAEELWFVDGVRRVELRVDASDGGRHAPGLFGSYAVGTVCSNGSATFGGHRVRRALVVGGRLGADRVAIDELVFEPECEASSDPDAPLLRLQRLMRAAEADLAEEMAVERGRVVLADGPLALSSFEVSSESPVVGVVKRAAREYLEAPQAALLVRLAPARRTPLFEIGDEDSRRRRYAWYVRIAAVRAGQHDRSGLVRCEVRAGIGLDAAIATADRVTASLPWYAGRPWDARTPQNVVPIAALEQWLRHRMGDTRLVRRALMEYLAEAA
ncbi:MAG TPA: hypothetical protein VJQ09_05390 [Candidatus Limnocylindria bacterium]|nr:hypothetical protein [Candidatus Limnocylindria bacterium]